MPETRRRKKILIKTWISRELLLFFHKLDFKNDLLGSSKFLKKHGFYRIFIKCTTKYYLHVDTMQKSDKIINLN